MRQLVFMSVATLGLAATPALAANAYWNGVAPMSFGPSEIRSQGNDATPYPLDLATTVGVNGDYDGPRAQEPAASPQSNLALGDMDSDSGPSTAG